MNVLLIDNNKKILKIKFHLGTNVGGTDPKGNYENVMTRNRTYKLKYMLCVN